MKSKRLKSLGGTVLIMVLTVMMVLIIILMATMTVVTTANQRVYTKYEESQAYYTARSSLDVFVEKMLNDANYKVGSETQGYQLQKMLYELKCYNNATVDNPKGNGTTDMSKNKTSLKGSDGTKTWSGMASKDSLVFEVKLPKLAGPTSGTLYGRFDDGDFADDSPQYVPTTIKIDLIDRTYDDGDNRSKDYIKLKITATSSFNGVERTAAAVIATNKPSANTATRAVTITGDGAGGVNNNAILGGMATMSTSTSIQNTFDYWGNSYIDGKIDVGSGSSNARFVATDNQWVYVGGDLTADEGGFGMKGAYDISHEERRPNFYIAGNFKPKQMTSGGSGDGEKINIIVAQNCVIEGNGYEHYGDMYVMGDLTVKGLGFKIHGDLYVKGNIDLSQESGAQNGFEILDGGSLKVAGADGIKGDAAKDRVKIGGVAVLQTNPDACKVAPSAMPKIDEDSDTHEIVVNWKKTGSVDQKIAESDNLYGQFYRYGKPSGTQKEGTVTASEYAFLSKEELEKLMKEDGDFEKPEDFKVIHDYIEAAGAVPYLPAEVDGSGTYVLPKGDSGISHTWEIKSGEVELFLEANSDGSPTGYGFGTVIVDSGATLKVYAPPGNYVFNNFRFITDQVAGSGYLYVGEYSSLNGDGTPNISGLMDMPISYYFEGESTVTCNNDGSIFIGHFYIPRGKFDGSTSGYSGLSSRIRYNGQSYTGGPSSSMNFVIIGSLLCDSFVPGGSGKGSVAFVKSSTDKPKAEGEVFLTLKPNKYVRN